MPRTRKTPSAKKSPTTAKSSPRKARHSKSARGAANKTNKPCTTTATAASKQSQLIALLRSPAGGTIAQMVDLTGWQPHSVRGVISGSLRKKLGLSVTTTVEGAHRSRVYRIVEAP